MRKLLLPLIVLVLVLAACGNNSGNSSKDSDKKAETKSYKTDDGKTIKIPKDPKRIALLHLHTQVELKIRWKYRCSK